MNGNLPEVTTTCSGLLDRPVTPIMADIPASGYRVEWRIVDPDLKRLLEKMADEHRDTINQLINQIEVKT